MRRSQQSCQKLTLLTLYGPALCLAVALFCASYKMEQYPLHGRTFRVMAPAKLLTEKERPGRVGGLQIAPASVGQKPALLHRPASLTCIYPSPLQNHLPGALVPPTRRRKIVLPELTFFSFRPPPPRFMS
ncbi:MAG: hypothetical protein WCA10_15010 [Terracidiphilus sp.]